MIWNQIEDFNHLSWEGRAVCANCGSTKQPDDEFVFRPAFLDEVNGFPDICANCIREAADALGIGETGDLEVELDHTRQNIADLLEELGAARDALATVTRDNVRLQDVIEDLNAPVEELTAFDDED